MDQKETTSQMTWTEEERRRTIKNLKDKAIKYRADRKMLKYLEARAKIKAWSTPNLCKDYTEECASQLDLISCIVRHFPDKKDRKRCPASKSVDWSRDIGEKSR